MILSPTHGLGDRGASFMAKKKPRVDDSFVLFDVVYEDGTKSSRRKVASVDLEDGDDEAKTVIMAQDTKIAEKSANYRGSIKTIVRSPN
jgi:hypothetical protein